MGELPVFPTDRSQLSTTAAFDHLYERCERRVRGYVARRVTAGHVDDVVADTFLVAWRKIDSLPDDDESLLWLYRVAHRTVRQSWRATSRRRRLDDRLGSMPTASSPDPVDSVIVDDDVQLALAAAEQLNPNDAEILRLASWEMLSNSEIATVLELSANAVGQRLYRARKNLVKEFDRLAQRGKAPPATRRGGAT